MINSHKWDGLSTKMQDGGHFAVSMYQPKNALSLSSVLHACNLPSHHFNGAMK